MAGKFDPVRRSQLVTTYGIGAVLAVGDESFMVAGTDRWRPADPDLHEPRLERWLSNDTVIRGFRQPPATDGPDIPVVRFPRWYSCPKCTRLADHSRVAATHDSNQCASCNRTLVPSRFVVVCAKGHIADFPYMRWVHEGKPADSQDHELFIEAKGATASLRDLVITCRCGRRRTMDGAFDRPAFRGIASCLGQRPWLGGPNEDCGTVIRTLQRGASNVWFGSVRSAISIPPWSEAAFQLLNTYWTILRVIEPNALRGTIAKLGIADADFSVDDLIAAVEQRKLLEQGEATGPQTDAEFRRQEYEALVKGKQELSPGQQFVAEPGDVPPTLRPWISQVMLVKRLREVRALEGFTRLLPPGLGAELAPLARGEMDWLPAIEVQGEGMFLVLEESRLKEFEPAAAARAGWLDEQYRKRADEWGRPADREITARLIAAHTFAHALINQFALDAGYPAASLRERLYVFDDAAGILIYTATTDSAGSLGGIVAQARPESLYSSVTDAVTRYAWCSMDPVCIEAGAQGADALNLAACHACALLPETSCEHMNTLLDRALLVGTPEEPELGLFHGLTST